MSDSTPSAMTSSRPYLLRGLHEWIVDNGLTPQILIDSFHTDLNIPDSLRDNEKIVLNISPGAVRDLEIDNDYVSFVARFGGVSHGVVVPIAAVQAIYARENGQGMMFPDLDDDETGGDEDKPESSESRRAGDGKKRKPDLKVIK